VAVAARPRDASRRAFLGTSALVFAASAAVTIVWCASMSAMGGMPMPGGWTMSMAWMRMPGQTWPGAAASFLGMWLAMMVAMMLPSLVPMLSRYRHAVETIGEARLGRLTAFVGVAAGRRLDRAARCRPTPAPPGATACASASTAPAAAPVRW
jgi:predicted metal-binding membrane protein